MANVSNVKTDWQNVSAADYAENNAKAVNNRLTAARLNAIGQAIVDINGEMATPDYGDLPNGATLTLWYNSGWPPRPTNRTSVIVQWCSVDYQGIPPTALPGIDFLKVMEYQSIPTPDPDPPIVRDGTVLAITTLEDQTNGVAIGNSGDFTASGTGTTALTALTAAAYQGSLGMRGTTAANSRALVYSDTAAANTRVLDFYFRIQAITGNTYIAGCRDSIAGVNRCDIRINGDRSMTCRSSNIAVGSSEEEVQLQTFTWYRLEWRIEPVGQRVRVYDTANEEYVMDFIGSIDNALTDEYRIGTTASYPEDTVIDFDTLRVGDGWLVDP